MLWSPILLSHPPVPAPGKQKIVIITPIQRYSTDVDTESEASNLLKAAQGCFRIIFLEGFRVVVLILQINIGLGVAVLRVFLKWKQTNGMCNVKGYFNHKGFIQVFDWKNILKDVQLNGAWLLWLWQLHDNSYVKIIYNCTSIYVIIYLTTNWNWICSFITSSTLDMII